MHGHGLWMYEQTEQWVTPVPMSGVNCDLWCPGWNSKDLGGRPEQDPGYTYRPGHRYGIKNTLDKVASRISPDLDEIYKTQYAIWFDFNCLFRWRCSFWSSRPKNSVKAPIRRTREQTKPFRKSSVEFIQATNVYHNIYLHEHIHTYIDSYSYSYSYSF